MQDWALDSPAVADFLGHYGNPKTRHNLTQALSRWLNWCNDMRVCPVEPELDEASLYLDILGEDLAASTVAAHMSRLRTWHDWLMASGYEARNPWRVLRRRVVPGDAPQERRYLTPSERERFNRAARELHGRNGNVAYLLLPPLLRLGLRAGEIRNLRWGDIQPSANSEGHWTLAIRGKARARRIPLHAFIAQPLLMHCPDNADDMPIIACRNGSPASPSYISRLTVRIAEVAGLKVPHRVTPHCFRRSIAQSLIEKGAHMGAVQNMLGHKRAVTTEENYVKPIKRDLEIMAAQEALADFWDGDTDLVLDEFPEPDWASA